jgi:hypothetical protein
MGKSLFEERRERERERERVLQHTNGIKIGNLKKKKKKFERRNHSCMN